ncbi:DUF1223 domain-containing protein [Lysobacter tyrosinilyticus]
MRLPIHSPILLLISLLSLLSFSTQAAEACRIHSGATTLPLVELYTSEGCSSCPPADRWLSQRLARGDANYLAFHVDYWDDIGWPDRYASPMYSQRQRARVTAAGSQAVYTPQVMLGDLVNAPWSRERAWRSALQQTRGPAQAALALRLDRQQENWVVAIGAARLGSHTPAAQVWMALHVDGQTTEVRAGENRGRTLHHDRVVRQLKGPWTLGATALSQRLVLYVPTTSWGATLFAQDARGRILQSLDLDASDCSR